MKIYTTVLMLCIDFAATNEPGWRDSGGVRKRDFHVGYRQWLSSHMVSVTCAIDNCGSIQHVRKLGEWALERERHVPDTE